MASIVARGAQNEPVRAEPAVAMPADGGVAAPVPMPAMAMPMPMFDPSALFNNIPGFSNLMMGIVEYGPNGPVILPMYRWTIVGYSLLGLACYWLAGHLVRPRRRWRVSWHDLLMVMAITLVAGLGAQWLGIWPAIERRLGL